LSHPMLLLDMIYNHFRWRSKGERAGRPGCRG
jgi:hypothetical protein